MVVDDPQRLCGGASKYDDELGSDGLDLCVEKMPTRLDLVGPWCAVFGRAAFDDIADVDLVARVAHRLDHAIEELPGRTDKGEAGEVLFFSWALADEHELGVFSATGKHGLLASLGESARAAGLDLASLLLENAELRPLRWRRGAASRRWVRRRRSGWVAR